MNGSTQMVTEDKKDLTLKDESKGTIFLWLFLWSHLILLD